MLVLTRKINETIEIDIPGQESITIMLTDVVNKHKARIGIKAPRKYNIRRTELPPTDAEVAQLIKNEDAAYIPIS